MKKTNLIFVGLAILASFFLVGLSCSYSPNTTKTSTNSNQPVSQNTVSIANFSFNPATIQISAGAEVTFTNNDSTTHTVTFDSFASDNLTPGNFYKHTFATAGTYNYHCSIHPSMTGQVIVK